MFSLDKDLALLVLGTLLSIGGFIVTWLLLSFRSKLDSLEETDKQLENIVIGHREDVLKNYVTTSQLDSMKKDIIDRIDRFEQLVIRLTSERA